MKQFLLIALSLLLAINVLCQEEDELKEFFNEGDFFFKREDYQEAAYYYSKLIEQVPENANYNFKLGMTYLNIPGQENKAIPYLEKASKDFVPKKEYKGNSFEESKAPLHVYFYLGNAYRINNELNKALEAYDYFINHPTFLTNYNEGIVLNEIKSCERAKIIQDCPTKADIIELKEPINSDASEINPAISGDEKSMVFIRKLKFYDALYYTVNNNGKWSEPVNINPQVGSDGDYYPTNLSMDGTELYMVRKNQYHTDIYVSYLENGYWSKAEPLNKHINKLSNENHASISPNGQLLVFTSDRKKNKGFDVFIASRISQKQWGKPKNIGSVINTEYDEATPYIANNGRTLFFSSKGHYNMGGYDIFYSNMEKGKWTTPINIGYPINDTGDNLFFVPLREGKTAYISKMSVFEKENIFKIDIHSNLTHIDFLNCPRE